MPERSSRTAEFVALFRALESRLPERRRLFHDPYAASFLGRPLRGALALAGVPVTGRLVPAAIDRGWPGTRVSVVVRTRYIDDAVAGADQAVILGAGFDTRALRLDLPRVVELDAPATGARLVFTYLDRGALGEIGAAARTVRRVGEPFSFGFDPAGLSGYLAERGLELADDVSAVDLAGRYLHPLGRRPPASPAFRIANAVIG